jgi:hypothetical protein
MLVLAVAVCLGCHQKQALAEPSWSDAVSRCAPGTKLDDCVAALKKAGVTAAVSKNAGRRKAMVDLKEPYEYLAFVTDETEAKAAGRITQAQFSLSATPGKERVDLMRWLAEHLKAAKSGSASDSGSALQCGAASSGPAWAADGVEDPEVQLALKGVPWNKPPSGKSPSAIFEKTKADGVRVCFMLPLNDRSTDYVQPQFTSVFADFVKSPLFAQKTQPAPAKP